MTATPGPRRTRLALDLLRELAATTAPMYGAQLAHTLNAPTGAVYPSLKRLVAADWLTTTEEEGDAPLIEGRPRRRYYFITQAGRDALIGY